MEDLSSGLSPGMAYVESSEELSVPQGSCDTAGDRVVAIGQGEPRHLVPVQ